LKSDLSWSVYRYNADTRLHNKVELQLFLYVLITSCRRMWELEVKLHALLNSLLYGVNPSVLRSGRLTPEEITLYESE